MDAEESATVDMTTSSKLARSVSRGPMYNFKGWERDALYHTRSGS